MTKIDVVPPNARFTHFGFWVTDLERMADFYQKLFKMHRTDEGYIEGHDLKADLVFLTRDPMVHHQIVLIGGKPEEISFNVINQISFLVEALSDLRKFWNILENKQDISDLYALTHGNAWSVYFKDPENNRVELYVDTDWYVEQPFRDELDFKLTDKEIMENTEKIVNQYNSCEPIDRWRKRVAKSIGLEGWKPS
jgi:catechol-2,3-dioxygenase